MDFLATGNRRMRWSLARRLRGALIVVALAVVSGTSTAQTLTTLFSFATGPSSAGAGPCALTLGPDGNFYGTTQSGTIFKITPAGALTVLNSFGDTGDGSPDTVLTLGPDGNFYGTTLSGGAHALGAVFTITRVGVLTTVYSFRVCHKTSETFLS